MKRTCNGPECTRPVKSVGLCTGHYMQYVRRGSLTPLQGKMTSPSVAERLFSKRIIDDLTDCWIWTGYVTPKGYGRMDFNGVRWKVHRLSWTEFMGPIEDDLTIDHLCRDRRCFNPDHLELVTAGENTLRRFRNVGQAA